MIDPVPAASLQVSPDTLRFDVDRVTMLKSRIGLMPPKPATVRAKLSAMVIRVIHRALFWVWPPIHGFNDALCHQLRRQAAMLLEHNSAMQSFQQNSEQLALIRRDISLLMAERSNLQKVHSELWIDVAKLKGQLEELRSSSSDRGHR
jgi:uncharacterized protein YlxW (UPF0749 family)